MSERINRSALARKMIKAEKPREEIINAIMATGSSRDSALSLLAQAARSLKVDAPKVSIPSGRRATKGHGTARDKLSVNLRIDAVERLRQEAEDRGVFPGALAAVLLELICESAEGGAFNLFDAVLDGELPRKATP